MGNTSVTGNNQSLSIKENTSEYSLENQYYINKGTNHTYISLKI